MKIYIGFSRPQSWFAPFSWLIRLFEDTPYSHVFLSWKTRNEVWVVYQASGIMVNFMSMANFLRKAQVVESYEVEISDEQYRSLIKFCLENAGTDYGIKQVFGMAIQKLFRLKNNPLSDGRKTQVCSELVGHVIKNYLNIDEQVDLDSAGPRLINNLCERHFKRI